MLKMKAMLMSNKRLAATLCVILIAAIFVAMLVFGAFPNASVKPADALTVTTPQNQIYHFNISDMAVGRFIDNGVYYVESELLHEAFINPKGNVYLMIKPDVVNPISNEGVYAASSGLPSVWGTLSKTFGPNEAIGPSLYDTSCGQLPIKVRESMIYNSQVDGTQVYNNAFNIVVADNKVSITFDTSLYKTSLFAQNDNFADIADRYFFFVYHYNVDGTCGRGAFFDDPFLGHTDDHSDRYYIGKPVKYNAGSIGLPANPVKEGYTFVNWYYDAALTEPYVDGDAIFPNTQLFPKFNINYYDVDYYVQGAKFFSGQVAYNTLLEAPEITGYSFQGWFTDSALNNPHDGIVKSNVVLYAKYSANAYLFTVYGHNGVVVSHDTVYYDSAINIVSLNIPTVQGYTFEGWYYDPAFTSSASLSVDVKGDVNLYAKYNINSYIVKIYALGSILREENVLYGSDFVFDDPVIQGYTYVNLFIDSDYTVLNNVTVVTGNITAYARYIPIVYNYTAYGYNGAVLVNGSVFYGDTISVVAPEIPGSTFQGWYTDSGFVTVFDIYSPVYKDLAIYAKYDIKLYSVKIYGVDSILTTLNLIGGSYIPANNQVAPIVDGYTFVGWYNDSDFVNLYDFDSPIQSTTQIFAKYTADIYSVKLYGGVTGEVLLDTLTVNHGELLNLSDLIAPDIAGFEFIGWRINGMTVFVVTNPITSQYNLIADYDRIEYDINFYDFDFNLLVTESITFGSRMSALYRFKSPPAVVGYTFDGWYSDSNFITSIISDYLVDSNLDLYPKYLIKTYNYVIYGFNGIELHSDTLIYGSTIPVERFVAPPVVGYNFEAWYRDASLNYAFNASVPLTCDVNVYAKYVIKKFNIASYGFDNLLLYSGLANYGDKVNAGALSYGQVTGYTFDDWYTNVEKTVKFNAEAGVYNNLSLYANYVRNAYEYKVYGFNNEVIEFGSIVYGDNLPVFVAPDVPGYSFVGFYTDASFGYVYDPSVPVQNNLYLYARYTSDLYDYIVYGYADVVLSEGQVYFSNTIPAVTAPLVAGKTFVGWFTDADFTTSFVFTNVVHGDLTIYAKYINTSYSYVVYGFNNEVIASDSLNYGQIIPAIFVPTIEGYVFDGFYTSSTYEVKYNFDNVPNADVVLYAKYIIAPEPEPTPTSNSANTWKIIGGCIGLVLLVGVISLLVKKFVPRKKRF